MQTQTSGRIFLLVTGIFYIVYGVFGFISALSVDVMGQTLGGLGNIFGVPNVGKKVNDYAFFMIIASVYAFIIGIMGITHRNNSNMGGTLIVLGIIDIILGFIDIFFITKMFTASVLIFVLVIPICYIVGAYKNKNELNYNQNNNNNNKKIKICPFCANEIKKEAIICQYCNRDVPKDIMNENKSIGPNEIKIIRINGSNNADFILDVYIDEDEKISLENEEEEKIIKIKNGTHKMTVKYNVSLDYKVFEINNDSKIYNINIYPKLKINEL